MATFHIQTDRPAYLPGETVTGKLLLNVPAKIANTQGLTLRFSAMECLKSMQQVETQPPVSSGHQLKSHQVHNQPDYPPEQVYHADDLEISVCHSQSNQNSQLRPKYIKSSQNKYYQLSYLQKRNEFAKEIVYLMPAGTLQAGQYCYPFSLQTFDNWPASFIQDSTNQRAHVQYHLTATLLPLTGRFHFTHTKDIIINDPISALAVHNFQEEIASLYCIKKGRTEYSISMDKEGYQSGDTAHVLIAVDNNQCQVNVESATITLRHNLALKYQQNTITSATVVFQRDIVCTVRAGVIIGRKNFEIGIQTTDSSSFNEEPAYFFGISTVSQIQA